LQGLVRVVALPPVAALAGQVLLDLFRQHDADGGLVLAQPQLRHSDLAGGRGVGDSWSAHVLSRGATGPAHRGAKPGRRLRVPERAHEGKRRCDCGGYERVRPSPGPDRGGECHSQHTGTPDLPQTASQLPSLFPPPLQMHSYVQHGGGMALHAHALCVLHDHGRGMLALGRRSQRNNTHPRPRGKVLSNLRHVYANPDVHLGTSHPPGAREWPHFSRDALQEEILEYAFFSVGKALRPFALPVISSQLPPPGKKTRKKLLLPAVTAKGHPPPWSHLPCFVGRGARRKTFGPRFRSQHMPGLGGAPSNLLP